MLEQTLNGRPIIITPCGSEYMVYYEGEISFLSERPVTDQVREELKHQINEIRGRMLGNVLVGLLMQPLLNTQSQ